MKHLFINQNKFYKGLSYRLVIAVLVILCTVIVSYHYFFKASKKMTGAELKLVETITLKKESIQQTISLLGTIRSLHATTLLAEATGTFEPLKVPGHPVHKGELIAKIINPDIDNNLQLSETAAKIAKVQYERLLSLHKTGYVNAQEVEEKKQIWINAQKELSKANIEFDSMRFYAPFDGIIGVYKKREGAQINQGDRVVSLYDPKALIVDFDIPCTNIVSPIKVGQTVRVLKTNYPLSHMQKMIDDETHMCPADVNITCDNCLIGTSIDVELVVQEKKDTIVIPHDALFLRNSKPFVYIVNQGKIVLTSVTLGLQNKSRVEILTGLVSGQQLVIKGQERLYNDMFVQIYQPTDTTKLATTNSTSKT